MVLAICNELHMLRTLMQFTSCSGKSVVSLRGRLLLFPCLGMGFPRQRRETVETFRAILSRLWNRIGTPMQSLYHTYVSTIAFSARVYCQGFSNGISVEWNTILVFQYMKSLWCFMPYALNILSLWLQWNLVATAIISHIIHSLIVFVVRYVGSVGCTKILCGCLHSLHRQLRLGVLRWSVSDLL